MGGSAGGSGHQWVRTLLTNKSDITNWYLGFPGLPPFNRNMHKTTWVSDRDATSFADWVGVLSSYLALPEHQLVAGRWRVIMNINCHSIDSLFDTHPEVT